jgi:hypothetical protein
MTGFGRVEECKAERRKKQIPGGNDSKKGKGNGEGNREGKGRSRFPEGMTERKARASANTTATANRGVLRCAQMTAQNWQLQLQGRLTALSGLGGPAVGVWLVGGGGVGVGGGWVVRGGIGGASGRRRLGCGAGGWGAARAFVIVAVFARWEDVDGTEPGGGEPGPVFFGGVGRVHAEAVAAGCVVVEVGGDVGVHEGGVIDEGVLAVAAVVLCLDEEGGGSELVGGVDGVELGVIGRDGEVGGVDDDGEVGAGADMGVGVGRGGS